VQDGNPVRPHPYFILIKMADPNQNLGSWCEILITEKGRHNRFISPQSQTICHIKDAGE